MIQVQDLAYSFMGRSSPPALEGIRFSLAPGRLLCLAGANGGGKSTLLRLLAGLSRPSAGTVRVGDVVSPGQERRLREVVGLVMQEADLQILGSTVEEDVLLGVPSGDAPAREAALALARRFGLAEVLARPVQALSYGQKRRLCLTTALLGRRERPSGPLALFLDEPFAGLDYPASLEMRALLAANRASGLTQIVAAHDLDPIIDLADVLAVLQRGRLVIFGPPSQVLDQVAAAGVRPPCSWLAGQGLTPWE